jgi:proteasome lid subunit RPN8/RPN11
MFVPPETLDQILKIGQENLPNEACGILIPLPGNPILRELSNSHWTPETGYSVNNDELVNALKAILNDHPTLTLTKSDVVVWHTHPSGYIGPSEDDLRYKEADLQYLVVAMPNGEATMF